MPPSTIARSPSGPATASSLEVAFAAGEPWAFEAAYHEFKRALFATALTVLNDRNEAEDCVHDVIVRLWQRRGAYAASRGSLRAFLIVCVRNDALSRRRKSANRLRIERSNTPAELSEPPDESLADRDTIARALQTLNEKQREAIRLAYECGLTHDQIARRLNEPLGTIKSRLSIAIRAMRADFIAKGEML